MTGYALAYAPCVRCRQPFGFNPVRVPSSSAVTGEKEPICPACFDWLNTHREALGLPKWELPEGAYEPCEESEL
jgi:hypothetical protein